MAANLTPAQIDRKVSTLAEQVRRAGISYRLARADRQNTGKRIESAREAKARQRRDTLDAKLSDLCRDLGVAIPRTY